MSATGSVMSQPTAARRMKMAYEYAQIRQVFALSCVPDCWVFPVSLLEHAYMRKMKA